MVFKKSKQVFHIQSFSTLSTVKSGNFVTFFAQNIFFTKFHEGNPYFFSGRKFIKKIPLDVSMVIFALG
jgi:hypothetical protein